MLRLQRNNLPSLFHSQSNACTLKCTPEPYANLRTCLGAHSAFPGHQLEQDHQGQKGGWDEPTLMTYCICTEVPGFPCDSATQPSGIGLRVRMTHGEATRGIEASGPWVQRLAEAIPDVPTRLGTGGEARDLDAVPIFPLKLLFSRDSSSA